MISLLEIEKFADGRNILNFSVDTADELVLFPFIGAKWENMGHGYSVPTVGTTKLKKIRNNYLRRTFMAIDIVARALAVSGKQNLENYYTKTESDGRYVKSSENFVKAFTIPNGASSGTLTADVKQKLCNPDGHNYYVFDDTSQMILKYSFNEDSEIIQYKAIYLQNDKAYDITMQILPSNGSWRRSQTVLNGATANPTLTGTEAELTG